MNQRHNLMEKMLTAMELKRRTAQSWKFLRRLPEKIFQDVF
jgi:hypothetical protein